MFDRFFRPAQLSSRSAADVDSASLRAQRTRSTPGSVSIVALVRSCFVVALSGFAWSAADAQDAVNGRTLFNSILVPGNPSCASGGCHGPNPDLNINGVKNGDTPGGIAFAIARVRQMAFLQNQLSSSQIADLSAYIANPAAANGPSISVSESAIAFGNVSVGQSAPTRNVTISNGGNSALVVSSISVSSNEFSATGSGCAQVAAGGTCTVSVGFRPQSLGAKSATLTINHNAAGGSSSVPLSGTGVSQPQSTAQVSASAVAFGRAFVGQIVRIETVTLTNTGATALTLAETSGQAPHFLVVDNGCFAGAVVPPGGSCQLELAFAPQSATPLAATMTIAHDGVGGASSIDLSGTGVALPAGARLMVEYYIPAFDYFFMTSRPDEQAILDGLASFRRTGFAFPVFVATAANRAGLTRYFFPEAARNAQRGTHFYTLLDSEKALLASLNPTNAYTRGKGFDEGVDSFAALPSVEGVNGTCAAGLQPVYRVFRGNQRFPDDANHRFTIVRSVYDAFVARGWDNEGVKLCVPAP